MTTRIAETFQQLQAQGHQAFMPFLTAGDPDLSVTTSLIAELGKRGVDLIEVGFPYSDPIADGPVIQASYTRALEQKLKVGDIFQAVGDLDTDTLPPLVAMVSYALIFRTGPEKFVAQAAEAGFSGFIVPDLPGDEAADFAEIVRTQNLDLIQLVAPTTPPERVERILQTASGFLYCIAVAGTTGEREDVSTSLLDQLKWLKQKTDLPLAVGFGISRPEHVNELKGVADGVIVGSAIVRQLESLSQSPDETEQVIQKVGEFAAEMVSATHC